MNEDTFEQPPYAKNIDEVYLSSIESLVRPPKAIPVPEWKLFNNCVGGFRPREFSILCGSTGSGKTTFLANLSAQLLKQRAKHFVMSVETGHTDYMTRILSVLEGDDLNTGAAVSPQKAAEIHARHGGLISQRNIEFSLYEDRVPVEQLMQDLLFMREKRGCEIAFIDNLNFFMEVTNEANAVLEMDRVIHSLVIFCKRVDIHIVMVMHPKKPGGPGGGGGTRVRDEFDIKGSSTAVQVCSPARNRGGAGLTANDRKHTISGSGIVPRRKLLRTDFALHSSVNSPSTRCAAVVHSPGKQSSLILTAPATSRSQPYETI